MILHAEDHGAVEQAEEGELAEGEGRVMDEVLAALGLPAMGHTGLASTQLQPVSQIDPENPDQVYADEVM